LIEDAHRLGAGLGLAVWNENEAGPYQAIPQPGASWQPQGKPSRRPHEYIRGGTAKMLTLLHPETGQVRVKGVRNSTNSVLHAWLQQELTAITLALPRGPLAGEGDRAQWQRWQEGLGVRFTLRERLPPLRVLLILDNLAGHKTPAFVCWLMDHGIMPLYTPLGGSWLNMAESIQRILVSRALLGQCPSGPGQIIEWLEATARAWNREPTPFVWGGKRSARRERARQRRHALGGSGACTLRTVRRARAKGYEHDK
jgi:hypothetical protein